MNRIPTFALLLIFMSGAASAQECKYEKYFYWSEMATLDYQAGNWAGANDKFKKTFSKAPFPLGADLNLALKTAVQVRDTLWADTLAVYLAKGGIPLAFFQPFRNYEWYDAFEHSFDQYRAWYNTRFDTVLIEKMTKLYIRDSLFNAQYHLWRTRKIEMPLDEMIAGAKGISREFKEIISEHGFPCEQNMGYWYRDGKIDEFPLLVLLAHIYQRGELLYKDRLTNIICDGKFRRTQQAVLNGFNGYGDNTGVEQEMKIRYEQYRMKN